MIRPTRISLIRHGHIVNPDDVFHGRLPHFPLSDVGREQAKAAAASLDGQDVAAVFTSPMLRARQTAEILQARLDAPVEATPLLNEIDSPFDGRSHEEMAARDWDFYTGVAAPYEQPADILARIQRFMDEVRAARTGQHVVGVSHADPITFALLWALGQPVTLQNRNKLDVFGLPDNYPATASISTFLFQTAEANEIPTVRYVRPW